MIYIKRILASLTILMIGNYFWLNYFFGLSTTIYWIEVIVGIGFYVLYSIIPQVFTGRKTKHMSFRMKVLYGGCDLLSVSAYSLIIQVILSLIVYRYSPIEVTLINSILCGVLLFLLAFQGGLRLLLLSKQIKVFRKILLLLIWWIPIINVIYISKITRVARLECEVETFLKEMDEVRIENKVCETKYPVLMVHGVFFRDWQYFNYWGRIPKELMRNGADVHYGRQQSALSIEKSACELKEHLKLILEKTGAKKVNIIAHSKGGLDARYAISKLGMAPFVASLTTINTPHRGCKWADILLEKLPGSFVNRVAGRYNKIFKKMGDAGPDFIEAVEDLTWKRAQKFNKEVLDSPNILYQSVMSKMKSAGSAKFPLNLAYRIIWHYQREENDGLVPISSGKWGDYRGLLTGSTKRGISHADMIDLGRENIPGFEVRNYYVNLIKDLKEKGY